MIVYKPGEDLDVVLVGVQLLQVLEAGYRLRQVCEAVAGDDEGLQLDLGSVEQSHYGSRHFIPQKEVQIWAQIRRTVISPWKTHFQDVYEN